MSLDVFTQRISTYRDWIIREEARQEEIRKQLDVALAECVRINNHQELLKVVLVLLEQSNIVSRDHMKTEIENLVTQGLQIIFENPYLQFTIEFITKRNQTEAEFTIAEIHENNKIETGGEIISTRGGGVVDIISIALRIIIMQLLHAKGPLILDEPAKFVSAHYINNFGKFLTQISKTFDRQIIMVTHDAKLAEFASQIFEVSQHNGISKVCGQPQN